MIEAADVVGSLPARTGTLTITVNIGDLNDVTPAWVGHQLAPFVGYDVTVSEDLPVGSQVLDIDATDADIGHNGRLTFAITTVSGNFTIDPDYGIIYTLTGLDRETDATHELVIEVDNLILQCFFFTVMWVSSHLLC